MNVEFLYDRFNSAENIDIDSNTVFKHELENHRRLLKSIIDSVPDFIFFKNADSQFIGCNYAFANKIMGRAEADIVGKTDFDLLKNKESAKLFRQRDIAVFNANSTLIKEETVCMTDGSIIEVA